MAGQHAKDPLGYGNPAEDMDDLTAQLENAMQNYRAGGNDNDDDFDLGDSSALPPGHAHGLDRYRMMHQQSLGPLGTSSVEHPNLTYGQLVGRSSHEDEPYAAASPQGEGSSVPINEAPASAADGSNGHGQAHMQPPRAGHSQDGAGPAGSTPLHGIQGVRSRGPQAPMVFSVSDPVKREMAGFLGLKAGHVTYLVSTQLRPSAMQSGFTRGPTFSVRRRFRDFVALADVLKVRFRGYFLPPRPEKNAVEGQRMTDMFVEERRAALERYLNRLAHHPVVAMSEELRVFVELEGELENNPVWTMLVPPPKAGLVEGTAKFSKQLLGLEQSVLDPVQAAQPTKTSADPLRALRETAQAMTSNSAGSNTQLPTGEVDLRREREMLEGKRDALVLATREAERLVHRMDRIALVCGDMGLAFFKLSKFEEAEGPHLAQATGTVRQSQALASVTKLLATSMVRAGRLMRRNVGKSAHELSTLHEQLASLPPAIKGLSTREKQLLTTETLQADLDARNRSIRDLEMAGSKVLGGDPSKIKKSEELRADVAKLECSISAAKAEYDRICAINRQELVRVQGEFQEDILRMTHSFVSAQALSAQRAAEVWLQLANELCANPAQLAQARSMVSEAQQAFQGPADPQMVQQLTAEPELRVQYSAEVPPGGPQAASGVVETGWGAMQAAEGGTGDPFHPGGPSITPGAGPLG